MIMGTLRQGTMGGARVMVFDTSGIGPEHLRIWGGGGGNLERGGIRRGRHPPPSPLVDREGCCGHGGGVGSSF
jgi:hypothetical protein